MPTISHSASRHLATQDQWLACADERHAAPLTSELATSIIKTPCAKRPVASPVTRRCRLRQAGFTLIEMLVVTAIAGALSSIAYPSFQSQVQKARRADAVVSMMTLQLAQERWRTNSSSYGSLAQIGAQSTSHSGHYAMQVSALTAEGYEALATANGAQAGDSNCRYMKLRVNGTVVTMSSGPDAEAVNTDAVNRRCWSL